jgi:hypothetical protein
MGWRSFTSPVLRGHNNWEQLAKSQFRADVARYPGDQGFGELIEDLKNISNEFRLWWSHHDVKTIPDGHKSMTHPALGHLDFEYVSLQVQVVIYTCSPETASNLTKLLSEK